MMPDIEIVTHCWLYTRLLAYQLSSLLLHPPKVNVLVDVFCCPDDPKTVVYAEWYKRQCDPEGTVEIRPWLLPKERLLRSAYRRENQYQDRS